MRTTVSMRSTTMTHQGERLQGLQRVPSSLHHVEQGPPLLLLQG